MKDKKYFNEETMRYRVKIFDPCKKLKSGVAYILKEKELVLPFRGKIKNKSKTSGTGIYELKREDEDSVYYIVLPFGKKKKKYTLDNIYKMDETYINNILEEENLSIDNDILLLDTGDVYCPPIYDNDNILQKIIKDALSRKKIDLKAYANRFDNPTDMNNHKRSLMKHDMTEKKFRRWCSILDIDFEIRYKDKTGCLNPMGEGYVGRSSTYTGIGVNDKDAYTPEEDEDDIFTPDEDTKDFETGEF